MNTESKISVKAGTQGLYIVDVAGEHLANIANNSGKWMAYKIRYNERGGIEIDGPETQVKIHGSYNGPTIERQMAAVLDI